MSQPRPSLPDAVTTVRIIAILRGLAPDDAVSVARALAEAGVRAIEVTVDSPSALEVIRELAGLDDVSAGAGTVLSVEQAERAVEAGASFLITPIVDIEVIGWAAARGVPIMPGAMTPSEIHTAWSAGAAGVKLFPAGPLGHRYLSAIRAPLPQIPLIPTGGIGADDVAPFLAAGAVAVALGSELAAGGDAHEAGRRARAILRTIATQA
ncbi:MAG TPA: bifunctional 4-hydroxy-2-oxoglutarate aldolase/2-dehydro-3-deoxy-phosphogluconate aldolase [Gaiellales bacterium]|jgi:2-dehydro-3-deoxyphosphogluconate aldolase/(4S)-4-hydroxy-2-oxoglutarate aldolase